jgi:anaerobic dimethyl sulfoxide reductase subunit A
MGMSVLEISKRKFLTGMAAIAGSAALSGCGGASDSDEVLYYTETPPEDPGETGSEEIYPGIMGHSCGSKCMMWVHVKNGVIKRITGDERPDRIAGNPSGVYDPQRRGCIKCRGKRNWFYRSDRLRYPLKQMGTRGDPNGFVRIPWGEAIREISEKIKAILAKPYTGSDPYFNLPENRDRWSKGTFYCRTGSGDLEMLSGVMLGANLVNSFAIKHSLCRSIYSHPAPDHVHTYTMFGGFGGDITAPVNNPLDIFNSDQLVLWGSNPADTNFGSDTLHRMRQFRDSGKPVITIDHRVNRTARTLGGKHIAPIGGTDSALVFGMIYHLLEKQLAETEGAGIHNGRWLDFAMINRSMHGFFDLPTPTTADFHDTAPRVAANPGSPHDDPTVPVTFVQPCDGPAEAAKYAVPAGASVSAYIFGTDDRLVTAGLNSGVSIYPNTIGYNVNSAAEAPDGTEDELYRKRAPIYGQTVKTPEWAEMITGVPAADIRWLAEQMIGRKTSFFIGGGSARSNEGEQTPWSLFLLAILTGHYGRNGETFGAIVYTQEYGQTSGLTPPIPANPDITYRKILNQIVNFNRLNEEKMSFTNLGWEKNSYNQYAHYGKTTYQACHWPDLAENGGSGKSRWNNSEVKYVPKLLADFNSGGNHLGNQCGENGAITGALAAGTLYDLIITLDIFMTTSAQFSDYVLPATTHFEREQLISQAYSPTGLVYVPQILTPPGEAKSDYKIMEELADAINPGSGLYVSGYKSLERLHEEAYNNYMTVGASHNSLIGKPSYEEFKKIGFIPCNVQPTDPAQGQKHLLNPTHAAIRNFMENGVNDGTTGYPFPTPSGKFEAYAQGLVEEYEARRFYNFDDGDLDGGLANRYPGYSAGDMELKLPSPTHPGIYTKSCEYGNNRDDNPHRYAEPGIATWTPVSAAYAPMTGYYKFNPAIVPATDNSKKLRFVYPIPMYIPILEGRHACDNKQQSDYPAGYPNIDILRHPDLLNLRSDYPVCLSSQHSLFRAHSCADNVDYAAETYKRGNDGDSAFLDPNRGFGTITSGKGVHAADLGVYEPIYISPADAEAFGGIQTGDVLLVSSRRGSLLAAASVTKTIRDGTSLMAEGAWTSFRKCDITLAGGTTLNDFNVCVGGSINSITTQRQSRIALGSTYGTYQRIKIQKVLSVELA